MRGEHFHFFKKKTAKTGTLPFLESVGFKPPNLDKLPKDQKSSEMLAAAAARSVSARARPVFASATPVVSQTEPR